VNCIKLGSPLKIASQIYTIASRHFVDKAPGTKVYFPCYAEKFKVPSSTFKEDLEPQTLNVEP
jgi:hypothetical protein